MALEPFVENLDGVAEEHRSLYVEAQRSDGTTFHRLDVVKKDGWELSKTDGLVSALEKERKARSQYGSITPEEAQKALDRVSHLESEISRIKNHTSKAEAQEKEEIKVLQQELAQAKETAAALKSSYANTLQEDTARKALMEAGFKAKNDVMSVHLERDLETAEIDGKMVVVVKGSDGHRMIAGEDGTPRLMTPLDRAKELSTDPRFSDLLDGSGTSGGGTIGGGGTPPANIGGVRTIRASEAANMTNEQFEQVALGKLIVVPG